MVVIDFFIYIVFASIVRDDDYDSSEEDRISSEDEHLNDSTMDNDIIASAETLKNRLHYLFRKLVHAIARPEHPLFLCVDGKNNDFACPSLSIARPVRWMKYNICIAFHCYTIA